MAEKILIDRPYLALRLNNHIFRETVYGIVKRLHFFLSHIETERKRLGLKVEEMCILDVGCGTGVSVTIPLANAGYSMTGLDTDLPSIERGREIAQQLSNINFVNADLSKSPLSDYFHVVICSEVLEHLEKPEELICQMRVVMQQKGLLLATVPNGYGYFEIERFLEGPFPWLNLATDRLQRRVANRFGSEELRSRQKSELGVYQLAWTSLAPDQTHSQRFTPSRIKALLTNQGFDLIDFRNRTFLAGNNILANLVRDWDSFLLWNGEVADRLPHWLCSGWMIAARSTLPSRTKELDMGGMPIGN